MRSEPRISDDGLPPDGAGSAIPAIEPGKSPREIGDLLERCRNYLLAVAGQELPRHLSGKIAPSDVVQETLAIGYEKFGAFRGTSDEQLARWLRTILLNYVHNVGDTFSTARRDVAREVSFDTDALEASATSPSGELARREEWTQLQTALSQLPEELRRIILLRHRENVSFEEIGRLLSRSEATARRIWTQAIQCLQQKLQFHESRA